MDQNAEERQQDEDHGEDESLKQGGSVNAMMAAGEEVQQEEGGSADAMMSGGEEEELIRQLHDDDSPPNREAANITPEDTSVSLSSHHYSNVEEVDGKEEEEPSDCSVVLGMDDEVSILGEVVCAHQLIKDDGGHSDDNKVDENDVNNMNPFAVVSFRKKEIHRTLKSAEAGTRNPFWTISSRSLFLIKATVRDLAYDGDLEVSLWTKQKDALNLHVIDTIFLGKASISSETILQNCNEQPVVVNLYDQVMEEGLGSRGSLTMHFRMATRADEAYVVDFGNRGSVRSPLEKQTSDGSLNSVPSLTTRSSPEREKSASGPLGSLFGTAQSSSTNVNTSSSPTGSSNRTKNPPFLQQQQDQGKNKDIVPMPTEVDDTKVAGDSLVHALSSAFKSKSFYDKKSSQQKILVKPHPDPRRVGDTTYLSACEMRQETMKPSQQWVEAGSGRLGKLYLEILSCHDLPNMDSGETMGNLTDAFCCAVFEDAMVQTNVIDDELSPHWLPWTQRAFIFGIIHPASMLYLGCFDYDLGISDHEAIGRVAVNISNFQRDTDYLLTYSLYPSSNVTERTANGTLTIRLRVEYNDEKQALLEALKDRPVFHVNVKREKTLKVIHYTCFGEYGDENEEKFDRTVIMSYIQEILYYKKMLSYLFGDVFRSLVFWRGQVKVMGLMLPLHSFLFFFAGTTLVERPSMFPAFMILSVAWIMMAMGTKRQQHPSPWERGQSFWHYVEILRTGRSNLRIRRIAANEGSKEAAAYEKQWSDRLAKDEDMANRQWQLQQELNDLGSEKIHTQMAGGMIIPIELLGKLARWQGMIGRWIRKCRFIKIIVTWEESIVSFWVTACFLVAGLVSLLLPWAFILTWLGRGIVWGCLGPHMMIVDAYLRNDADDEKLLEKTMEKFKEDRLQARERYQQASKLKDLKSLMFGKYNALVPNFNLNRHCDRPLACSFAGLHQKDESENGNALEKKCVPGQQFFGVMIPRTEPSALEFEKEQPKLEQTLKALLRGIDHIHEEKRQKRHDRREMSIRATLPDSVGFECLESFSSSAGLDDKDNNARNAVGDDNMSIASSVDVDEDSKTAVISFFRQASTRNRQRESLRFGYELLSSGSTSDPNETKGSKDSSGTVPGVSRSSSWPLVGADAPETTGENGKEEEGMGDGDRPLSTGRMANFLKDPVEAMANMSGDGDVAVEDDNGIEVVLRTIEEEEHSTTTVPSSDSHHEEPDEGGDTTQPCDDDDDKLTPEDTTNSNNMASHNHSNKDRECYHASRHGRQDGAELWDGGIEQEDPKKQPHSVAISGSSGRLEIEARDGDETNLTEVARRTKSEDDHDDSQSTSNESSKSKGKNSSVSVVVLYRQD